MILRDNKPDILFPGTWCPVTGGRNDEEDLEQAALRELREEIGFVPLDLATLGISIKGNGFFFGRLTDKERGAIVLGEGQKYDFFSYDDLLTLDIGGAMKPYLERRSRVFRRMAETGLPPFGRELGLATWNGRRS
ncbi:NUDIX domain-containing protein [Patescibacteria group bacterium]|nr:MAG: NUDIX domain-containing protein [Patescibacteria group bacterium]